MPNAPVLPEVETDAEPAAEPEVDDNPETPTDPDPWPVTDGLPEVDDPRTDAEELESLRQFADGSFACYDTVRKAERLVEGAKAALKIAKAEFETAVAEWGSYTEKNRHPLFGDPLEKGSTPAANSQDDEPWRAVTLGSIGVSDWVCTILSDHIRTTLGDAVDWIDSHPDTTVPFEVIGGIGEAKSLEITQAMDRYWEEHPRETPAAEAEPIACPNCGSTEIDEDDGACAKCHEPGVAPVTADFETNED